MTIKTTYVLVKVPATEDVTQRAILDYVRDAVKSWCGQFQPPGVDGPHGQWGDPLWGIGDKITVKLAKTEG